MKQQATSAALPNIPVTVNPALDKIQTKGFFQDKVDKVNETLRRTKEAKKEKDGQEHQALQAP